MQRRLAVGLIPFSLLWACGGATSRTAIPKPDPNLVEIEITPVRSLVQAGRPGTLAARVRIRTRDLPQEHSPPVNLGLVIDTSSSMEGRAIAEARAAARLVLDSMQDGDRLSVVVFHSTAEVLVPSVVLGRKSRAAVVRSIGRMTARGTTDLETGLVKGIEEVKRSLRSDGINRIVLLSDGVPNDATSVIAMAQAAGQAGISITALGLGLEYDETLLTEVAQQSGGRFHYIQDSSRVASVMREEVLELRRVVGRNMQLALTPGPAVTMNAVLGQAPSQSGRVTHLPIGELGQGEVRDFYLELALAPHGDGTSIELADAVLVFDDAFGNAGQLERRTFAAVKATQDRSAVQESEDAELLRGLERARASAATIWIIAEARAGRLQAARRRLDEAARSARVQAKKFEDPELTRLATSLDALRPALASLASASAPSPVGGATARAPAQSAESAQVVKSTHSAAMETLQ